MISAGSIGQTLARIFSRCGTICFLRDSHNLILPCWRQCDAKIVYDKKLRVFMVFSAQRRRLAVIGASPTRQLRVSVMRAIREITVVELLRKGVPILHASALSLQTEGLAFVGPKFAGKTTFLIAGLIATRGAFVANDRLVVDITRNGAVARGFPTIISMRTGEPSFFPSFKSHLGRCNFDHARSLAELRMRVAQEEQTCPPERLSLSAAQLCDALGVSLQPEAKLRALVIPHVDCSERQSKIRRLNVRGAADLIGDGLFRAGMQPVEETMFSDFLGHGPLVGVDHRPFSDALARLLPTYRFTLGGDIIRQPERSADFFVELLGR